jgi:hypothetical protein
MMMLKLALCGIKEECLLESVMLELAICGIEEMCLLELVMFELASYQIIKSKLIVAILLTVLGTVLFLLCH